MARSQPSLRSQAAARAEAEAAAAARRQRVRRVAALAAGAVALVAVVVLVTVLVLRGGDDGEVAAVDPTALELGCTSCHTVDGRRSEGPTWDGLWGSEVTLADGTVTIADEAYLRRAVLDPAADVREGYTASMPLIEVTDEQLDALMAHLEDLAG
jgi:cytochrome c1